MLVAQRREMDPKKRKAIRDAADLPDVGRHAVAGGTRPHVPRPWLAIWPAVALVLAMFGFNMLGTPCATCTDPRLKGR